MSRPNIPKRIRSEILIANRHSCCVCQKPRVHIHHINGDNSDNRFENLATLCLDHHDYATSPPGLTASLRPEEIERYKRAWEQECKDYSLRMARSRTALFMIDYKNAERIRQLYAQLTQPELVFAYDQMISQFHEETELREQQGFNVSIEPTTKWTPLLERLITWVPAGMPHPDPFAAIPGHPKDPLLPQIEWSQKPPAFMVYDIWCQVMMRALVLNRETVQLEYLAQVDDFSEIDLAGRLISITGRVKGDARPPDQYKEHPTCSTDFSFEQDNLVLVSRLNLKTHYIYSDTAAMCLSGGPESGIALFRGIDDIIENGRERRIRFACTPLLLGARALEI